VWALGYNRNIEELIENAKHVNVVAYSYSDINEVPPLHYHLSDATGRTVEVTFVEGRIVVIDNPIGVLTNNPDLNWHYENLKHYMHVTPYKIDNTFSKQFNLGNMNGTFGLPGGYTSGERFVRAAYLVHHLLPDSDDHPILDAFRILDHVSVPKGAVRPSDNGFYYTLYQTVFNLTTKTLYIKYYDSNTITELQLTDDLINRDDLVVFSRKNKGLYTEKVNG
ncbi:MAG: linear amide C-N hydrolase, partial [Finegoldia magna]|nr:linear amide C-N hydrolase [Finegoldia magna]